jgi:hypothetical protein
MALVTPLYDEMARLNETESLAAFEARSQRLLRIVPRLPAALQEKVRKEAETIAAEISGTHARANLRVVRSRANAAFRGKGAVFLYLLFVAGVLLFGLGADYLQSERTESVAIAKSCAEAATAGATANLPGICGTPAPKPSATPDPASEVAKAVEGLGTAMVACQDAAAQSGVAGSACDPIADAMKAALDP